MDILVIVSPTARISEVKKLSLLLNDLMKEQYKILFVKISKSNKKIEEYLLNHNYHNFECLLDNDLSVAAKLVKLREIQINNIIVLGLVNNDNLTKYLDYYIGTNTNLFIVTPTYGIFSDASLLVNEGAYLLNSKYDLKKI